MADAGDHKPLNAIAVVGRMKIWLVTVGEPLPVVDPGNPRLLRTGVLAERLQARGHSVVWWTSTFDHYQKRHRSTDDMSFAWRGGEIRMLRSVGYSQNVSLARFIEHAQIARRFALYARKETPPDVLLCSLPTIELAAVCVRYGMECGVPVLLDVRDLWPDVLINYAPSGWRWLARIALLKWIRSTRFALSNCAGIIGISEGYLSWAQRMGGRCRTPADAVFPLGYVAPAASSEEIAEVESNLRKTGLDAEKTIVWYVGSFGRQYDLEPVIIAARLFQDAKIENVQFVITGDGELGPRWRALAKGLQNMIFTGWVDGSVICYLRRTAEIGLQPYVQNAPQGLPNKLFEYLSAGIPVVSSLSGESKELIASHDCGLTYQAGSGDDCFTKIMSLVTDETRRRRMGLNGKALFEEKFEATKVTLKLISHLELIASRGIPL